MSTTETTMVAPRAAVLREPAWIGTAVGGLVLVAALALLEAGAHTTVVLALAGAGTVLACAVLGPGALARGRRSAGLVLLVGAVVVAFAFVVLAALVLGVGADRSSLFSLVAGLTYDLLTGGAITLLVILVAGTGGFVLLADGLRVRAAGGQGSGWRRLTGPAAARAGFPWGIVTGAGLIALAALMVFVFASPYVSAAGGPFELLVLAAVPVVVAVAIGTPFLVGGVARADRTSAVDALEEERLRVSAHLHDSVLQTLALVQRQADDPAAVARLARRQEQTLRSWMAGDTELSADTLAGTIRDVVAEVEDERGLRVEVSIIGDRPTDRGGEALAAAVREALRNAARHAPVSPVYVFCEISPDRVEAFVRDEGPGFVVGAVPRERRGVRDSIVGRMTAVGGHASVESVVGEGTEVVLRIGAPR